MLYALLGVVVIAMLAMAIAGRSRFPLINQMVAAVVLPVENGITAIGNAGDGVRGYWRAMTVLQSENEQLKKENDELRAANIQMASISAENRELRTLLEYKNQHKQQTVVAAKVIARNFGDAQDSIYIDAGQDKGLARDMAVVHGGLVGVVDEVYADNARVLLMTSPRFRIGARVLRADSRAVGIVGGIGAASSQLLMEHIAREASVREGDVIITSGYSGSHPEDILIGKVTKVHMDSVGLLQQADLEATADVADVERVLVITGFSPAPKITLPTGGQAK